MSDAEKIAELEGELSKFRQEMDAKNQRIQELETNGCVLILLMLSHNLNVLKRHKLLSRPSTAWAVRPW